MRSGSLLTLCTAFVIASAVPALASPHVRRGPTAPRLNHAHGAKSPAHFTAPHTGIAPDRATQIQNALIKAGYLTGTPSGTWDAQSQAAMEKLQADNGWQTKMVPDSRAIIKLGLGPNSSTASTSPASSTEMPETTTLFAGDSALSRPSNQ
jgi:hypothetical protein